MFRKDKFQNVTKNSLLTFMVSFTFLAIIFYRMKILPFGDSTMLVWDMGTQYSAFMSYLTGLKNGLSLFPYSLQGGLGGNMYGLIAYYLASPLNLIFLFIDTSSIPLAISYIMLIKTGLSATTMHIYLSSKRNDCFSIIFGCFYALSSFALCFQYNLMWMDALYLLPLVVLGIDRITEGKSGILYGITLAITIFSNYYIGYMVCLFSVLYFVGIFIYKRSNFKVIIRYATNSILAGGISAFITVPSALALQNSSSGRILSFKDLLNFSNTFNLKYVSRYLWAGGFDTNQGILGQFPMLYSGSIAIFLVVFSFLSHGISKAKKILYFYILAILFLSLYLKGPYLIWHGMISPSGCPWRFAFIWIFCVLMIAYDAIPYIKIDNWKAILITTAIIFLDIIILILSEGFRLSYLINLFFIFCFICGSFLSNLKLNNSIDLTVFLVLICCCGFELIYNGSKVHEIQFTSLYQSNAQYQQNLELINSTQDSYDIQSPILRTAILCDMGNAFNSGYQFHVNGINMYASTENENTWNVYRELGLGKPIWESDNEYDANATYLTTNILGIKYLFDYSQYDSPLPHKINLANNYSIFVNDSSLPLGFLVNDNALEICNLKTDNLFDKQNMLFHSLLCAPTENPYTIVANDTIGLNRFESYMLNKIPQIFRLENNLLTDCNFIAQENSELICSACITCSDFTTDIKVTGNSITGNFNNPCPSAYACFSIPYEKSWTATVDGVETDIISGMGGFLLVPICSGAHEIVIRYHVPGAVAGLIISFLSIIALLIICFFVKKKAKL